MIPASGYTGPVRSLVGECGAVDYWCPGCGSCDIRKGADDTFLCSSCGRAFRPIMFGPLPDDERLYDIYVDGKRAGNRSDRDGVSEGTWYAAMDVELNDGTYTEIARRFYGHEPTEEEMMDLATAVVSAFDLRGYPDMLKVGESAVLPDGVPVKVTRVRNVKPRRGGR